MGEPEANTSGSTPPKRRWPRPVVWLLAATGVVTAFVIALIVGGWILLWSLLMPDAWSEVGPGRVIAETLKRPVVTAILGWTVLRIEVVDPFDGARFDRDEWLAMHNYEYGDNHRGPMANDLRRILLAERMTREQVLEMLGPTDWHAKPRLLVYTLGMWSGYGIDYDTLDIHFDEDGRVDLVEINRQ